MKRAVSVSIGTSKRDKAVEVDLLGQRVRLERIGTDGDMKRAARLFAELDGEVDALGVGGADLGLQVDDRWYPLYSVLPMVRQVRRTPITDGAGLKNTLEAGLAQSLDQHLGDRIAPRRVLITSGADRWGMTRSFVEAGYECLFGDLMFGLGLPIPLRSPQALKRLAALLMPIAGRLPFSWVYPIGEKQEMRTPRWGDAYAWATVIAGDNHYIKRFMPERLEGKTIVTNTTTEEDVQLFRRAGVRHLMTSTPVFEGRSFGTNAMEAGLIAASGKGRRLRHDELSSVIADLGLRPGLQELT
ncbi:MAG: quinate 5-dehydrogenase [Anaerolineales bacterium]